MADGFADSGQDSGSEPRQVAGGPEKGINAWAQALAAVALFGGIAGALWWEEGRHQGRADSGPAVCERSHGAKPSKPVSGAQLCTALNRSDLPVLLGTPTEHAQTASGNESTITSADGSKTVSPEADVDLATYSLKLSASDDDLPVSELAGFLGSTAQTKTVLGHPAVLYSDRTIALSFQLGGGKVDSGPGGIARSLVVARDAKDGGGFFEVSIWRQDDVTPDDAALLRVAEKVLPTVPGWSAG